MKKGLICLLLAGLLLCAVSCGNDPATGKETDTRQNGESQTQTVTPSETDPKTETGTEEESFQPDPFDDGKWSKVY